MNQLSLLSKVVLVLIDFQICALESSKLPGHSLFAFLESDSSPLPLLELFEEAAGGGASRLVVTAPKHDSGRTGRQISTCSPTGRASASM
mmetsp:Transcript_34895/g.74225  ORF Transcript_34895/g.74225 Transcript_34895/m.74225 type:complete len:90 (+) Transcript_34895:71-340(+)